MIILEVTVVVVVVAITVAVAVAVAVAVVVVVVVVVVKRSGPHLTTSLIPSVLFFFLMVQKTT